MLGRSHLSLKRHLSEGLCLDRRDTAVEGRRSADYSIVRLLRDLRPHGLNRLLYSSNLMSLLLSDCWLRLH